VESYSLKVTPETHFVNWQQDPHGNYLARFVFPEKSRALEINVDLVAAMTVINPFDFFVQESAQRYPFRYEDWLARELRPFLEWTEADETFDAWLRTVDRSEQSTVQMLVDLNRRIQEEICYEIRLEPGVQTPGETLRLKKGSCRDSAWFLVQTLRHLGLAARFVSGYLIQLTADIPSLDGPSGPTKDFTDLHAWAEAYIPGAGWIGLDPTSGLLAGEGHLPLACTPDPLSAAPITGLVDACDVEFSFHMEVRRITETPRVTKPYSEEQWQRVQVLGDQIDSQLLQDDVRLTMGGEPTFISIDDMDGPEWNVTAVGPAKYRLSVELIKRLRKQFAVGGLLHFGQGKWYPGEQLPRWALACYWRRDGQPLWLDDRLLADETRDYGFGLEDARKFSRQLAKNLGVKSRYIVPVFEDAMYYLWKEQQLPVNVDPTDSRLRDPEERARLARVYQRGLDQPVGYVMPLTIQWWQTKSETRWRSGPWPVRPERMFLLPGDSPIGLRLPLDALPWQSATASVGTGPIDPTSPATPLPERRNLGPQLYLRGVPDATAIPGISEQQTINPPDTDELDEESNDPVGTESVVRTALCIEPRSGRLYVFMPPVQRLEEYLDLISHIEVTANDLNMPVIIEGYLPPSDPRLLQIKVTPDPGVIEVNVQPASSWPELVQITSTLYEEARLSRLGTEKFDLDGKHTGTGGGNHVVLGGPSPLDSPFLRRPDLLRSFIAYWNNHPSLSYLFSGRFVGPTSQAPRLDEGRRDALYEMQVAFQTIPLPPDYCPPWLVDRIFRNLLVDLTGNTHRAEFCIDKLYSPDSATGRLGLVEFRAFEMPPHAQMSLTQQLLIRSLVAHFWRTPYQRPLIDWGTWLHDRFLLPHFVRQDFQEVLRDLQLAGFAFDGDWFDAHYEFRFPLIGKISHQGVELELRSAIEPWNVLGEEPGAGGTVRYVDSSVERLQVKVRGLIGDRYGIAVNGREVPLHPTGVHGEFVAAVRYRAWQPASCLHPTIPVHTPLVFDLVDRWENRSIGGCTYHVAHPAGRNYETFPVNSNEAEARRAARFEAIGHTPGQLRPTVSKVNPHFPLTLDLRVSS
jgi:uncharacterized protein (DUF2126 family)